VAVFANQTSMVGNRHLVDTLKSLGVDIRVIFGPSTGSAAWLMRAKKSATIPTRKRVFRDLPLWQ